MQDDVVSAYLEFQEFLACFWGMLSQPRLPVTEASRVCGCCIRCGIRG